MDERSRAALSRAGITAVSDNLPSGASVRLSSDFLQFFRPELEARFLRQPSAIAAAPLPSSKP